jgi:hypothetical protein
VGISGTGFFLRWRQERQAAKLVKPDYPATDETMKIECEEQEIDNAKRQ